MRSTISAWLERRKIKKILDKMPECPLKTLDMYKIAPFEIYKTRTVINMDYKSFDFSSEYFELRHRTSFERAVSIIQSKMMFGTDGNEGAHFELLTGSINLAAEDGVLLYFTWRGEQANVPALNHQKRKNVLCHVCAHEKRIDENTGDGYWESRIYPGTHKGLHCIGMSPKSDPETILRFNEPVPIAITTKDEFASSQKSLV